MLLYWANLTAFSEEKAKDYLTMISESRQEKVSNLKRASDRIACIGAGLLVQIAMREYRKDTPAFFRENQPLNEEYDSDGGKPYCRELPEFHYSISHSGQYAVCLVSDAECGVDIQEHRVVNMSVAERFFGKEEQELIMRAPHREEVFYCLWTAHESYIKLTGLGLKDFRNFYVKNDYKTIVDAKGKWKANLKFCEFLEEYTICCCDLHAKTAPIIIEIDLENVKKQ